MDQKTFLEAMTLLATQCGKQLSRAEVGLYDRAFGQAVGYGAACQTLDKVLVSRSARDLFPSVGDLRRMVGVGQELTIEEQADGVAARIIAAVARRGYYWFHMLAWPGCAKEELGEWGWQVVSQWGGWQNLVEDSAKVDVGVFRAQLRRLAVTVGLEAKAGNTRAPALPKPATGTPARLEPGLARLANPLPPGDS